MGGEQKGKVQRVSLHNGVAPNGFTFQRFSYTTKNENLQLLYNYRIDMTIEDKDSFSVYLAQKC